jgi:hypothetical protein
MPIVARKTRPTLQKPPVFRVPRVKQPIPVPASPLPVVVKLKAAS